MGALTVAAQTNSDHLLTGHAYIPTYMIRTHKRVSPTLQFYSSTVSVSHLIHSTVSWGEGGGNVSCVVCWQVRQVSVYLVERVQVLHWGGSKTLHNIHKLGRREGEMTHNRGSKVPMAHSALSLSTKPDNLYCIVNCLAPDDIISTSKDSSLQVRAS